MKKFLIFVFTFLLGTCLAFSVGCVSKPESPSYTLYLEYTDGVLQGKAVYKFVNTENCDLNEVKFHLRANAYAQNAVNKPTTENSFDNAYYSGESFGKIEILNVIKDGNKATCELTENEEFLIVKETVENGETAQIEIDFTTTLPLANLRLGVTQKGVNLADFFPTACKIENGKFIQTPYSPIGDPYFFDSCDYFVQLTLPSCFTVASSGEPTQTLIDGEKTTYSYQLTGGRDFAFALSPDYTVSQKTVNGVTISYYSLSSDGEKFLDLAVDCYSFFENTFGKTPYSTFSLAETDFAFDGMEFTSLCFISADLSLEDKRLAIVHETAHEWWYGGVGNDQNECAFIDEGLCEYSTYLYLLSTDERKANAFIEGAKSAYKSFFSIEKTLSGKVDTTMRRSLSTFKSEYEYYCVAYAKSLLAFYEYQNVVGVETAKNNLKKLYLNNYLGEIGLEEIISALGKRAHFESFVQGKVLI